MDVGPELLVPAGAVVLMRWCQLQSTERVFWRFKVVDKVQLRVFLVLRFVAGVLWWPG